MGRMETTPSRRPSRITIELFGVPRLRAGVARWTWRPATSPARSGASASACPDLEGRSSATAGIHPAYKLSLNGDRFVTDPATPLADGDVLLLLAADVGG